MSKVPLFRPSYSGLEAEYVDRVLASGWWGLGPEVATLETEFAKLVDTPWAVGLNSATSAFELAFKYIAAQNRDGGVREVVIPSLTFASVAMAAIHAGFRVVFADVDPGTLSMSHETFMEAISPDTVAAVPTYFGGYPDAYPDRFFDDAGARGIYTLEDCAHAAGSTLPGGRQVGGRGDIGIFSLHAVKNIAAGDGGVLVGHDPKLKEWLVPARWCGINKSTWHRSEGGAYSWDYSIDDDGWKYHMTDLNAALARAQLQRLDKLNARRREVATHYTLEFANLGWLQLPTIPDRRMVSAWHLYVVRLPTQHDRDDFIVHMQERGIATGVHYRPIYHHPFVRAHGRFTLAGARVAEYEWRKMVTLPLFPDMSDSDVERIVAAVKDFKS